MPGIPSTPLIAGCGYTGTRLARALIARGRRPVGLTRTQPSADALGRQGIAPVVSNFDRPVEEPPAAVENGVVFYLVPPAGDAEDDDPRLRNFLAACGQERPARIVYVSTSGVYGDCGGEWVDETRPPAPRTARARRRLAAERILAEWSESAGGEYVIARVAGIYGPDRLPIDRLSETVVIRPEEAPWSNRIHVDDLVTVLLAAAERGRHGRVYNVADGAPTTMTDYFFRVADAAGRPRPKTVPLAQAEQYLSPGMLSFVQESRRLDVTRMKRELRVRLRYPDLDAGIADALPARRRA